VYKPSGGAPIGYTASWDNNYELADFITPETGQYQIRVYRQPDGDYNEISNSLGIAWVKDATYLPDLRNKDGWVSQLYVRNDGAVSRDGAIVPKVKIQYFDSNGTPTVQDECALSPNQLCPISVDELNRIPAGSTGSAIVGGGEDVSVVVETKKWTGADNLSAMGSAGLPESRTGFHFPHVAKRSYEWSQIVVVNASSGTANVSIRFFDRTGAEIGAAQQNFALAAAGQRTLDLLSVGGLPTDFLGSAYVSADKRLIAQVATHFSVSPINDSDTYEGISTGSTGTLYFPQVKRNQYGGSWYDYSGVVIQNLDNANSAPVSVYFYDRTGNLKSSFADTIPPLSAHGYNTRYYGEAPHDKIDALGLDFNGSVRVVSTNGRPIAGINRTWIEGGINATETYVGENSGAAGLVIPVVFRRTYGGGWADPQNNAAWLAHTGVIVHNLGGSTATVTIHFYTGDGPEITTASFTDSIPALAPHGYNTRYYGQAPQGKIDALGYNFGGSMWIECTNGQPIMAVVDAGLESKATYYYNGVHR
jgi:hypothetical protein